MKIFIQHIFHQNQVRSLDLHIQCIYQLKKS